MSPTNSQKSDHEEPLAETAEESVENPIEEPLEATSLDEALQDVTLDDGYDAVNDDENAANVEIDPAKTRHARPGAFRRSRDGETLKKGF